MPQLINTAARCIDINLPAKDEKGRATVETYRLKPGTGTPVEVPKQALSLPFVKAKIAKGELALHNGNAAASDSAGEGAGSGGGQSAKTAKGTKTAQGGAAGEGAGSSE